MNMHMMLAAALAAVSMTSAAETNYVNAANYGKAGMDGRTPATAFGTIQEAIDAASAGWTVSVAPGVYDKGGLFIEGDGTNRVVVTKPLTIVSSGSAADTFIVGADHPGAAAEVHGAGPAAVRCVYFATDAFVEGYDAPVIKGFSIRNGRSHFTSPSQGDTLGGRSGGITGDALAFYVVDCRIEENVGVRGGGMRYGTAIRCSFLHNHTMDRSNSAGRDIKCLHCLIVNNDGWTDLLDCTLVNCTLADSEAIVSDTSGDKLYNCVLQQSKAYATPNKGLARNSVLSTLFCSDAEDVVTNEPFPLFAPLCGDFRLRTGTRAIGLGDAKWIGELFGSAPAVVDIYLSADGVRLPTTGAINPGYKQTAVTAAGGAVLMTAAVQANGYQGYGIPLYAFSETAYGLLQVRGAENQKPLFALKRPDGDGTVMFPEMDDSVWCMMPPAGVVFTNTPLYSKTVVYVDPYGTDAADRGGFGLPLRTLQYAAGRIDGNTTIYAAAGTYAEGQSKGAGTSNRVVVSGKNVRFKGAGAGKSFIVGRSDTVCADGRGPSALRCASLTSAPDGACLQGFTLCGGRSNGKADTTETTGTSYYGGAFYGTATSQILDCVISNNIANRGSAVYVGVVRRTRIIDNLGYGLGILIGAQLESCLVTGNRGVRDVNADCSTYSCTLASTNKRDVCASTVAHTNAVVVDVRNGTSYHAFHVYDNMRGCLFDGYTYLADDTTSHVLDDHAIIAAANLADPVLGDFHATSDVASPVFTAGYLPDGYWKRCLTDCDGRPFRVVNGKFPTGCFHYPEQAVTIAAAKWGMVTPSGRVVVPAESGKLTVSATAVPDHRQILGFDVGGTFTPTTGDPAVFDYRPPTGGVASGSVVITPVFSTNWYVNASSTTRDDDPEAGFTPEKAWKTIARMKDTGCVVAGDCVHVASGVYNEAGYLDENNGNSCVWVPAGVTVVADEGPAKTIINGKYGAGATGRGEGAMRCVYLESGAVLKGFTLANGHSSGPVDTADVPKNGGGGFLASTKYNADASFGMIYGCVITNCSAGRGGAAYYGRIVNTKILDCLGAACNSTGSGSLMVGCFIDGCQQSQWCRNGGAVIRCTFGVRNGTGSNPFDGCALVDNCVVMADMTVSATQAAKFFSCLLRNGIAWTEEMKGNAPTCRWADVDEMGLDADGRPMTKNALVVDAAGAPQTKTAPFDVLLAGCDVAGGQRIYNGGKIDIGAYEYDWRGDYAALLGAGCTVASATANVKLETDAVSIPDGDVLAVDYRQQKVGGRRATVLASVASAGELAVTADGAAVGSIVGPRVGDQKLKLRDLNDVSRLVFDYSGDDFAALKSIASNPGIVLIVR